MQESITKQDRNNKNVLQKKHRLETVSKNILLEGLNRFNGAPTSDDYFAFISTVNDEDTQFPTLTKFTENFLSQINCTEFEFKLLSEY